MEFLPNVSDRIHGRNSPLALRHCRAEETEHRALASFALGTADVLLNPNNDRLEFHAGGTTRRLAFVELVNAVMAALELSQAQEAHLDSLDVTEESRLPGSNDN